MEASLLRDETEARRLTVFYHGGCPDGVTGAWAIYEALPASVRGQLAALGGAFAGGEPASPGRKVSTPVTPLLDQLACAGAVFHGIAHADPFPPSHLVQGRHVVYVDISPPWEHAAALAEAAASLAVLDHHRGARLGIEELRRAAEARGVPFAAVYDEARSGAQIAWDWARPGAARPELVDYVADRDLWTWRLEGSRAVNKALYVEGHVATIGAVAALHRAGAAPKGGEGGVSPEEPEFRRVLPGGLAPRGADYLAYEEGLLGRLTAGAYSATVAALLPGETEAREYCVLAVNSPVLQSELGEALMAKAGPEVHFVVIWSLAKARDEIWASARTTRPDVDLSVIVPCLVGGKGGGGHPRAAGFAIAGDSPGAVLRRPQKGLLSSA